MQLNVTWECSLYFHSAELVVRDLPTVVGSWVDQSPKKSIHSLERHPWKRFLPAKDVEELTWAVEVKIYGICKTSRRKKKNTKKLNKTASNVQALLFQKPKLSISMNARFVMNCWELVRLQVLELKEVRPMPYEPFLKAHCHCHWHYILLH